MWSKLDDSLLDHRKIFHAGELLGGKKKNGPALAEALFTIALMWTNKQLTDGFLPTPIVANLAHFDKPLIVADALVTAGMWEKAPGGFLIHDFHDHNFTAAQTRERRKSISDRRSESGRAGGLRSAERRYAGKQTGKQTVSK